MIVKITNCTVQRPGLCLTRTGQNVSLIFSDDFFDDISKDDFIKILKNNHNYKFNGLFFNATNSSKIQIQKEYIYLTPEQKLRIERKEKIKRLRKI